MIELNKITWAGTILGLIAIAMSISKWFLLGDDQSQLILGMGLGLTIIGFTYFYEIIKQNDKKRNRLSERFDELEFWARAKMGYDKVEY